jgi:hypothetical protein
MIKKYGDKEGSEKYIKWKNKQGRSLTFFISMYGIDEGTKRYNSWVNSRKLTKENFIKKYGDKIGNEKYNNLIEKRKNQLSEKGYIEKYGKDEGLKKWKQRLESNKKASILAAKKRQKGRCNLKWYIDKYGEIEGENKYRNHVSSSRITLENLIRKYGIETGKKKYEEKNYKIKKSNTFDGYIERFGKEEGTKRWKSTSEKKKRSKSIERFIEIYGLTEGTTRFNNYKNNLKLSNSLEGYVIKYGKIDGLFKWREVTKKRIKWLQSKNRYSKVSQVLFHSLLKYIYDKENAFFAENQGEVQLGFYNPDFLYKNKIIEFYGNIYHANPSIFSEHDYPNPFSTLSSIEIWNKDKSRINEFIKNGYKVIVVWEKDFFDNQDYELLKCIDFLEVLSDKKFVQ